MEILVDLRHQDKGRAAQYGVFWTDYISECSAVLER